MVKNIIFGSGRVEGVVVRDTLRFAGVEIPHQQLLLVEKEQFAPPEHVWDGILGLAKTSLSVVGAPFFTRLQDLGVSPIFAFVPSHRTGSRVELRIGAAALDSPEVALETLAWLPSKDEGLWYVRASVGVGRGAMRRLLVDTGTTVIVMPPADILSYVHSAQPRRGCLFDKRMRRVRCACAEVASMPPLSFHFGAVTFSLGPPDLFQPLKQPIFGGEPACELQVSAARRGSDEWVLGDNFLRKVVLVFDYERNRVGFAAPAMQTSMEIRVVRGQGGAVVQARQFRHSTVVVREPEEGGSRSTLVHLSSQTADGDPLPVGTSARPVTLLAGAQAAAALGLVLCVAAALRLRLPKARGPPLRRLGQGHTAEAVADAAPLCANGEPC